MWHPPHRAFRTLRVLLALVLHVPDTQGISSHCLVKIRNLLPLCVLRQFTDFWKIPQPFLAWAQPASLTQQRCPRARAGRGGLGRREQGPRCPLTGRVLSSASSCSWPALAMPLCRLRHPAEGRRQPPPCSPRNCCPRSRGHAGPAPSEVGENEWEASRESTKANRDASQAF